MSAFDPGLPLTLDWLEECARLGRHPGSQLYVSIAGKPVVDLGLGAARPGKPMTPDTLNPWFSSGKPITAVAVAQLVESGRLAWTTPIVRWIPEFGAHGKEAVQLRHLLTHTGGFRSADAVPEDTGWADTLRRICDAPLEPGTTPGAQASYHTHSSWAILAELVQRVADEPFADHVAAKVFAPAGMASSHVRIPLEDFPSLEPDFGWMHLTDRGTIDPHPFWNTPASAAILRPGAFLRGPIHDLGRFYEALLADPSPLLQPATIETITRRQREGLFDDTFKHRIDFGYGLIINSNQYGPETVPYGFGRHASEGSFGHGGVQSSCAFADPKHRLVVAWLCNGLPGIRLHHQRGRELNSRLYQDLGLAN